MKVVLPPEVNTSNDNIPFRLHFPVHCKNNNIEGQPLENLKISCNLPKCFLQGSPLLVIGDEGYWVRNIRVLVMLQ